MRKAINEEGKRYGKLTVIKRNGSSKDGKDEPYAIVKVVH